MAVNDPMRRYEVAQRLERMRGRTGPADDLAPAVSPVSPVSPAAPAAPTPVAAPPVLVPAPLPRRRPRAAADRATATVADTRVPPQPSVPPQAPMRPSVPVPQPAPVPEAPALPLRPRFRGGLTSPPGAATAPAARARRPVPPVPGPPVVAATPLPATGPSETAPPPLAVTPEQLQVMIEAAAARLVDERATRPATAPEAWWVPGRGPTTLALEVLGGADAWVLAWVLHLRSGLPLVVVEDRPGGLRRAQGERRGVLLDLLDGQYLDVTGARSRFEVLVGGEAGQTRRPRYRLHPVPEGLDFAAYRSHLQDLERPRDGYAPPRWQEALTRATPEGVETVATRLLSGRGLPGMRAAEGA